MATLAQLIAELDSGPTPVRLAAAQTLASLGEDAAEAAPALVRALADPKVAEECVAVLEELPPPTSATADELAALLTVNEGDTAYWAATLLGRAGGDAAPHAEALAAVALAELAPLAARERAAWAIGKIGPSAAPAARTLGPLAGDDTRPRLSRLAADALRACGV